MKKRVFRKRYEDAVEALKKFEKLEKAENKELIVEKPKVEEKPLKPRKERIWKQ